MLNCWLYEFVLFRVSYLNNFTLVMLFNVCTFVKV